MKVSGIYQIQSKMHPERVYIGSSVDIDDRWRCHWKDIRKNEHHSHKLQRHFNKYGKDDLIFSIIEQFDFISKEHLLSREQYYLDNLAPYFNECKIAESQLGIKRSDEFKKKCSKTHSGKSLSEEHKKHIGKSLIGKTKGRKHAPRSDSVKQKIAKGMLGQQHTLGKHWYLSENNKQHMRDSWIDRKKPILQYDLHMNLIKEWPSATDAAKELSIGRYNICGCLYNKQNTAKGFIWKFKSSKKVA